MPTRRVCTDEIDASHVAKKRRVVAMGELLITPPLTPPATDIPHRNTISITSPKVFSMGDSDHNAITTGPDDSGQGTNVNEPSVASPDNALVAPRKKFLEPKGGTKAKAQIIYGDYLGYEAFIDRKPIHKLIDEVWKEYKFDEFNGAFGDLLKHKKDTVEDAVEDLTVRLRSINPNTILCEPWIARYMLAEKQRNRPNARKVRMAARALQGQDGIEGTASEDRPGGERLDEEAE